MVVSPVSAFETSIASRLTSPCAATTSVWPRTAMFALVAIWSTRYLDMLFPRPSPRQRIVTLRAWVEKNIAAWPAEFPAPTMCTSRPCVLGASLRDAP